MFNEDSSPTVYNCVIWGDSASMAGNLGEELFERLEGFSAAAEAAARQTLGGLNAVIKGAFEALIGEAAKPLFDELVALGNEFIEVLTTEDAAGLLQPNPEVVEAFQAIFNALKEGVIAARDFAKALGFEGFKTALSAVGAIINALVGVGRVLGVIFRGAVEALTQINKILPLASAELAQIVGAVTALNIALGAKGTQGILRPGPDSVWYPIR